MCARGGIGRRDGFRSHSERVRVQVLSGAPTKSPILSGFFVSERKQFGRRTALVRLPFSYAINILSVKLPSAS